MAALAPTSQWTPEDDLLLKNAVEAGASLETLAKGAVKFSRRYSFRRLQHRWYTLLYDPVMSAEAYQRMIDYERSSSKQNRSVHGKRRADSVRSCYFAKRKRMRNANQGFTSNNFFGEPMANELGLINTEVDLHELLASPSAEDMINFHLLLDPPERINGDQILNLSELESSLAPETCVELPDGARYGEMNIAVDNDLGTETNLEPQIMSSASFEDPVGPEYHNGIICCVLNTEDPDVPCNDYLAFPGNGKAPSLRMKTSIVASMKKKPRIGHKGQNTMKKELKTFGEWHVGSQTIESDREAFGTIVATHSGPKLVEKSFPASDRFKSHFTSAVASNQYGRMPVEFRNQEVNASFGSRDNMMLETASASDQEQRCDGNVEIPCYSDIESMVLDMDLGPDDQDSCSSRKVANYQNEDAKRTIIKLEQGAHAYMQRAIQSHGAYGVLYGRHSKHYIKKPEVLLGRATHDASVDIDLSREGRENKISRRQAVIKMEEDGSFCIKNLGRSSISVNNTIAYTGQRHGLQSNCLIEIRGLQFIFEANQRLRRPCKSIFG